MTSAPQRRQPGGKIADAEHADEVRDQLLAPEEELGVLRLEGLEAFVRQSDLTPERRVVRRLLVERARRGEVAGQAVYVQLEELLGPVEVLEVMLAQVA